MKDRILEAIYKGIDKGLMLFRSDNSTFSKSSTIDNETANTAIANIIVDDCIKTNSMNIELYEQIVKDAYYLVKDKKLLLDLCKLTIGNIGNECDLNWIDTSLITDMNYLFDARYNLWAKEFNGDISGWDVNNVIYMGCMFEECDMFNCDISGWNVGNVRYMEYMFELCRNFYQDLSGWDVRNVINHVDMFCGSVMWNEDYYPKFKN